MSHHVTFDQIRARLSCESTMPQVPLAAMKLSQLVDQELISQDVLRVAASDPSLTAGLLRSASSPLYALSPRPVADVRTALSILGVRGTKSVAMSVLMQSVIANCSQSHLDPQRFVQHSTFVGIMSKYVFLRRKQISSFESKVNGDEVFAAGVLHDLGKGLLAATYPQIYRDVVLEATARNLPTNEVFQEMFGGSLLSLTLGAFEAWKLPSVLGTLLVGDTEPIAHATIIYSDWIANVAGFSERSVAPVFEPSEEVRLLAGLPEDELPGAVKQVISHTQSCVAMPRAA